MLRAPKKLGLFGNRKAELRKNYERITDGRSNYLWQVITSLRWMIGVFCSTFPVGSADHGGHGQAESTVPTAFGERTTYARAPAMAAAG